MTMKYQLLNGLTGEFIANLDSYADGIAWQLCSSFPGQYVIKELQ